MRLRKAERAARLLTRRRNALLAQVEVFVAAGAQANGVSLALAMAAYVDALGRKPRPPASVDPTRILTPEVARALFGLRENGDSQ